jgi:hypothetical protein
LAATALVEQYDAKKLGVKKSAMRRTSLAAGTAVNKQHRKTSRISAFLKIYLVSSAHVEQAIAIGRQRGIQNISDGLVLFYGHG